MHKANTNDFHSSISALLICVALFLSCSNNAQSQNSSGDAGLFEDLPDCFDDELKNAIACHRKFIMHPENPIETVWVDSIGIDCPTYDFKLLTGRFMRADSFYIPVVVEYIAQGSSLKSRTAGYFWQFPFGSPIWDSVGYTIISSAMLNLVADYNEFSCDSIIRIDLGEWDIPVEISVPKIDIERLKVEGR